jgi:putative photosynthetic complex assembly protein
MNGPRERTAQPVLPPWAVPVFGLLLALLLVAVGTVRFSGRDIREPDAPTVAERALRITDAKTSIQVHDASTGALIEEFHGVDGEASFVRGSVRALVREREMRELPHDAAPFRLLARADGRLTLLDPATGQRLDLEAFGARNAAIYARLLQPTPRTTTLQ